MGYALEKFENEILTAAIYSLLFGSSFYAAAGTLTVLYQVEQPVLFVGAIIFFVFSVTAGILSDISKWLRKRKRDQDESK